jgi:outer membrane biosynthesis protein TonB
VILETGSLGAVIKVFEKCSRDSLRDWGVDPDLQDKIVRPIWVRDDSRWFSASDYPGTMLRQGKISEVRVRLLVDAAGNPTRCTSLSHYDEPDFNQVVCDKFMRRAKFEPAELADGTKVPSYYLKRVVFELGF